MIIGAGFLYISIHILDYSMYGNEQHKEHHEKTFCNYNPEVFDTLFNTRCNPEAPYTKNRNEMIHGIGAFTSAYILKIMFNLD
jgi:sterol desaturase/sphingolipid hydroxylase (fatty acid hydroxylase superfamily)